MTGWRLTVARVVAFLLLYVLSGLPMFAGSLLGWRRWETIPGTLLWALLIPLFWLGCRLLGRWVGVNSFDLAPAAGWGRALLGGVGLGSAHVGLILALIVGTGAAELSGLHLAGLGPLRLLIVAAEFLYVAVSEELLFRAFLAKLLPRRLSRAWVMGISAALFAVVHLQGGGDPRWLLLFFLLGLLWMGAYQRTGSLWPAIGMHWAYNVLNLLVIEQEQLLAKSWRMEAPWTLGLYVIGTTVILLLLPWLLRAKVAPSHGQRLSA